MKTAAAASRFLVGMTVAASLLTIMPANAAPSAHTGAVMAQNYYYAKPGKAEEVYRWRLHASEVLARLGFPRGRVLRHIGKPAKGTAQALPDVIWQCEYPSEHARAREYAAVSANPEFQAVEKHMETLLRRFQAGTYEVQERSSDMH